MRTIQFSKKYALVILFAALLQVSLMSSCSKDDDDPNGTTKADLELVAQGLSSPLGVVQPDDQSNRLFIIDQVGKIWVVKDGQMLTEPFLDISSKMVSLTPQYDERGLLGLAFHPDYQNNKKFYVFYTAPPRAGGPEPGEAWNNLTRVAEYKAGTNADKADPASERIILEADHPQMNHNGGTIAFGPDGYLYISIGDGGGANDVGPGHVSDWYGTNQGGNAQNIYANLMGKVLRIDVDNGNPYSIPTDNPFAGTTAKGEIWAYGLRNPYRFSFDMGGDQALYLGDAGQKLFEEINVIVKGGNYGWNVREGDVCFNSDSNLVIRPSCPSADSMGNALLAPWVTLKNLAHPQGGGQATVVVGGNVYRGSALPAYQGKYIFGSFSQTAQNPDAKLYLVSPGSNSYEDLQLEGYSGNLGMYLKGFGQDRAGEVYIATSAQLGVSGSSGKIYKIVAQ